MRQMTGMLVAMMMVAAVGPASAGKIGFVDAERAVMEVQEGQAKAMQLEAWAQPQQKKVEAAAARVAEIRQQIAQQRSVASPETLDRLGREELDARRVFEDAKRNFERDLSAKQDEFLAEVAVKVGRVASDYGKANGFDAILVLKAQPIIYLSEEANLTDTIIRLYNERFPGK
ncbi:MAG: OmpH family outer membrane protein [Acidobacteria bacterium]|nr:OmpH family outer membrane protein [Acidobacteriota bacterium]